jgi:hypothetical protein
MGTYVMLLPTLLWVVGGREMEELNDLTTLVRRKSGLLIVL